MTVMFCDWKGKTWNDVASNAQMLNQRKGKKPAVTEE